MKKKVILINPSRGLTAPFYHPHLGLAHLATMIKQSGDEVLVLDYNGYPKTPHIKEIMKKFRPDVIGITTFTPTYSATEEIVDYLRKKHNKIPIILGGPHVSCNVTDMLNTKGVDYLYIGEGESKIIELIKNAKKNAKPEIITGIMEDVTNLPFPDLKTFYGYEKIESYPLLTSRGCPYNCSFCAVKIVSSLKWRPRTIESCIQEIKIAQSYLPGLKRIVINDDNYSLDLKRGKKILREYIKNKFDYELEVSNVRADKIDAEFLDLLKKVKCELIGIGVESADPQVFKEVDKKEDFSKIEKAAKMIKSKGLRLSACMIIGLPYDNLEKTKKSIKFVKKIKADMVFWNMFTPLKGTNAYNWFEKNGTILHGKEQGFQPSDKSIMSDEPVVETKEFSFEERKKAFLMAKLETGNFSFTDPTPLFRSVRYIIKYNLYLSLLSGLIYGFQTRFRYVMFKLSKKLKKR